MSWKYLLLCFHLALSPASIKHSSPIPRLLFAVHTNLSLLINTVYYFLLHLQQAFLLLHKMVLLVTQKKPEIVFLFFFFWWLFCFLPCVLCACLITWVVRTLLLSKKPCVFLPLLSLISTAAWASNSREISSLLPPRAAWCSGDNLHTDTDYV